MDKYRYKYELLSGLMKFVLNSVFIIQILLMLLVFLTASYWFFTLIGSHLFDFCAPMAEAITSFVKRFYEREIDVGGEYLDTSLLLFDFITIFVVILISKLKFYIYVAIEKIDYTLVIDKRKEEKKLNEQLKHEAEKMLKKYDNAVIVLEFDAKDMRVDNIWGGDPKFGVTERVEEAIKIFYSTIKYHKNCSFAKTDNKVAVKISKFRDFDSVMILVEQTVSRIMENFKKKNWQLIVYTVVDTYFDNEDFRNDVYPAIKKLLSLKYRNEIVCYGNFSLRYDLLGEKAYYTVLKKGDYMLGDNVKLYNLVKKV